MTSAGRAAPSHGNAYEIFILVLTLMSLVVMVMLLLPLSDATLDTLRFYDNLICFVFLGDFALNLSQSRPRRDYFIRRRGWLDLLGSIPSLGILRLTGLLRLARISRLLRVARLLRGQHKKELISDIVHNRSQYALFITLLLVVLVLTMASVLVLEFESQSPDANIKTGGDALWWAFVTMTTVGYGDRYPVTGLGRTTAVAVMFLGVGVMEPWPASSPVCLSRRRPPNWPMRRWRSRARRLQPDPPCPQATPREWRQSWPIRAPSSG